MKKIFLILLFICFVGVVVLFAPFWLGFIFRDIDPVDTSDLQVEIQLPDVNAYDSLIQLEEGDVFDILDEAAEADGYLEPGLADELTFVNAVPTLTGFTDAINASAERASELFEDGDEETAIEELERSLYVAQMVQDAPGTLIQQLIAINAKETLLEKILELELDIDVSDFSDNETGFVRAIKLEFMLQENLVLDGGLENDMWFNADYYFHPNETIDTLTERALYAIEAAQADCGELYEELTLEPTPDFLFFTENAGGKLLIESVSPRISGNEPICELDELIEKVEAL